MTIKHPVYGTVTRVQLALQNVINGPTVEWRKDGVTYLAASGWVEIRRKEDV